MADLGAFGAALDTAQRRPDAELDTFQFCGHTLRVAEAVGAWPLLKFGKAADSGLDTEDAAGIAAMYDMIADTVDPRDWPLFQKVATDKKVKGDVLMSVCQALYQAIAARPTDRPADSSDGPQTTSSDSSGLSSAPPASSPAAPAPEAVVAPTPQPAAVPVATPTGSWASAPASPAPSLTPS